MPKAVTLKVNEGISLLGSLSGLRVEGTIDAGAYSIFGSTMADLPDLSSLRNVNAAWFGLISGVDGANSSGNAIRRAIASGGDILIPEGRYFFNETISLGSRFSGRSFYAESSYEVTFITLRSGPVIHVKNASDVLVAGIEFESELPPDDQASAAVLVDGCTNVVLGGLSIRGSYRSTRLVRISLKGFVSGGDRLRIKLGGDQVEIPHTSTRQDMLEKAVDKLDGLRQVSRAAIEGDETLLIELTAPGEVYLKAFRVDQDGNQTPLSISGRIDEPSSMTVPSASFLNGVFFRDCVYVLVTNCHFEEGVYTPVRFRRTTDGEARANTIHNTVRFAMIDQEKPYSQGCEVVDNRGSNVRHIFIKSEKGVPGTVIERNHLVIEEDAVTWGKPGGIIVVQGPNANIRGNTLSISPNVVRAMSGITVSQYGRGTIVAGNTISPAVFKSNPHYRLGEIGQAAIRVQNLKGSGQVRIENNQIGSPGGGRGIFVRADSVIVRDNYFEAEADSTGHLVVVDRASRSVQVNP
ncbi:right-handed parallel beta-helix repeat-containing protein [bacterium]|nr:right-handed parallel beta-helix repeat-containing protein [bacterium]